jgi:hypothetical protein
MTRVKTTTQVKTTTTVATVLGREIRPMVTEWLRRVKRVPALALIPLEDEDRAWHLPEVFYDLICRLGLPEQDRPLLYASARAYGQRRRKQGYSSDLIVAESKLIEGVIFHTLHLYKRELDHDKLLSDVVVIVGGLNLQLAQALSGLQPQQSRRAA